MLKRLAVLVCLCSYACGAGRTTEPSETVAVRDGGGVSASTVVDPPAAGPAVATVPNLTAYFDRGICFVTNKTGISQNIRIRVSQVLDEKDPANYEKQKHLIDETTVVPSGLTDFAVAAHKTYELCSGLYQYDCGRGDGLLAYQFIRHNNPCPQPTPTPTPTPTPSPTPPPCKKQAKGTFSIDSLSNSGNGYTIKDDGTTWKTVNLDKGKTPYTYEHDPDGSNLCLYWKNEKIGCSVASCGPGASWHGKVSFHCEEICR